MRGCPPTSPGGPNLPDLPDPKDPTRVSATRQGVIAMNIRPEGAIGAAALLALLFLWLGTGQFFNGMESR